MFDLGPALVAELLLLGSVTGFLAGLLGVGGGMLMVPFMTWILASRGVPPGLAVKMAIATSMATIVFTSVSSVRAHHGRQAVRWDLVRSMAPGLVLGGLLSGAGLFAVLRGPWLAAFFALFIGFSAVQMLLDRKPAPTRQMPGALGQFAVGSGIGLVSGLVGAGGAFLSVPFMTWCNVKMQNAIGTSAAIGLPIALAGTVGYLVNGWGAPDMPALTFGYVYLPALVLVSVVSTFFAPLGAKLAHRLPVATLKKVFAGMLVLLCAKMLHSIFA